MDLAAYDALTSCVDEIRVAKSGLSGEMTTESVDFILLQRDVMSNFWSARLGKTRSTEMGEPHKIVFPAEVLAAQERAIIRFENVCRAIIARERGQG